ncbi:hypothetical protein KKJ09_11045 [Xenorhabdus bovienii]|uniref:hypothetical protein n=1 Tax=Xenorhabdus bovienii TaxID=40576 RepID=UPI0023B2BF41|nr:hypothetical protein [Xenorhabdus bovienii]MDE9494114.1 hypothetical protein [Xenorhabdus bovienii]MDE9502651.1 hypothetical protein [Xenorhabdus bovienii]MDE9525348.1 hypothetical protein [Xenorhabdus bovienii]
MKSKCMNQRSTHFGDNIKTPFGCIFSLRNLHHQTRGLCLTISASKGGQMYRNLALPFRLREFFCHYSYVTICDGQEVRSG